MRFTPYAHLLGWGALLALAAITLVAPGATRMHATPWNFLQALALGAPVLALALRAADSTAPWRRPSGAWLGLALGYAGLSLVSACASPYRAPSLWVAAVALGAVASFLLWHDWLQADRDKRRAQMEEALFWAAGLAALASTAYWLIDVVRLEPAQIFSRAILERRNPHPLGHSNYTAGLMLLGLPWLARAAWRERGAKRGLAWAGVAMAALALFTSGSRGGLLGLAGLGAAAALLSGVRRKQLLLLLAATASVAAILAVANPRIRSMLGPQYPEAPPNLSNVQREAMLVAGVAMGRERPLLGWGPGSTPLAYPRFRAQLDGGADTVLQLHATPVQLWAETGAPGLAAGALFLGLVFRARRRCPTSAAALAGYAVFSLTDYQLDVPVFAFAVAAMSARLAWPSERPVSAPGRFSLAGVALASLAGVAFLGGRDRSAELTVEALAMANDPAQGERAVALLRDSLALNPDQEAAHFNLGWLLLARDPAAAESHFLSAARLVPDKGGVYFGVGLARLNQGNPAGAARALALECLNEPRFLASPWWTLPPLKALRPAATDAFLEMTRRVQDSPRARGWPAEQARRLATLATRLGHVSPGPEQVYRRERTGYPVLLRHLDLEPPRDLYDVREDPRFPESVSFPLPPKGWAPTPLLLELADLPIRTP